MLEGGPWEKCAPCNRKDKCLWFIESRKCYKRSEINAGNVREMLANCFEDYETKKVESRNW